MSGPFSSGVGEYFTGVGGDPSGIGGLGATIRPVGADEATATPNPVVSAVRKAYPLVSTAGLVACTYHGYRRTKSIGWTLGWALFGSALPFLAVPWAVAQGYGKPKSGR